MKKIKKTLKIFFILIVFIFSFLNTVSVSAAGGAGWFYTVGTPAKEMGPYTTAGLISSDEACVTNKNKDPGKPTGVCYWGEGIAVSSFSPTNGKVGSIITIKGVGFLAGNTSSVLFNGTPATSFSVVSTDTITATVPTGATSGLIKITSPTRGEGQGGYFTLDPATPITGKQPAAGDKYDPVYHLLAPIGTFTEIKTDDIGGYFDKIFLIAIGLCGALAVIMFIIGGVQYMGEESIFGKTKGKEQMTSAILGLLIALGSWALLNTINPDLLGGSGLLISSANIKIEPLYDRGNSDQKNTNGESTRCTPVLSGPCSVANLTPIFGADKAVAMSKICNMESSGIENLASGTDICKPTNTALGATNPFSFGLFQVNLAANGILAGADCVGLFDKAVRGSDAIEPKYNSGFNCKILPEKEALYNTCKNRLLNTATNLEIAKSLFNNKSGMGNWTGDKRFCASAFN